MSASERHRNGAIDDVPRTNVGGRAVATALAHERILFDADPFGSENRAYLATGPLQQSGMSFTGRMNMTGLSPLTDGLVSTNAGATLAELRRNGNQRPRGRRTERRATGRSRDGSGRRVRSGPGTRGGDGAGNLRIHDRTPRPRSDNCIAIGPAGENRVRFASVMTFDSRAFGRGGLGAVLGSKNVKCVTFEGDAAPPVEIPDPPEMDIHREAAQSDDLMRRQGTTGSTEFINDNFALPTRYFSEYEFEHADRIGGNAVEEKEVQEGRVLGLRLRLQAADAGRGDGRRNRRAGVRNRLRVRLEPGRRRHRRRDAGERTV